MTCVVVSARKLDRGREGDKEGERMIERARASTRKTAKRESKKATKRKCMCEREMERAEKGAKARETTRARKREGGKWGIECGIQDESESVRAWHRECPWYAHSWSHVHTTHGSKHTAQRWENWTVHSRVIWLVAQRTATHTTFITSERLMSELLRSKRRVTWMLLCACVYVLDRTYHRTPTANTQHQNPPWRDRRVERQLNTRQTILDMSTFEKTRCGFAERCFSKHRFECSCHGLTEDLRITIQVRHIYECSYDGLTED